MAVTIYTIPITDAFKEKDGCPFCRLHEALELSKLEYTIGAAMMEPSVRIEMNSLGFCESHFDKLHSMKNKLSLALILESHIDHLLSSLSSELSGKRGFGRKNTEGDSGDFLKGMSESCFVCDKVEAVEKRYFSNTVYMWERDPAFRELLKQQPYFCLSHAAALLSAGRSELKPRDYEPLYEAVIQRMREYLEAVLNDTTRFTKSFDHRNAGIILGEEKYCIDKAKKILK